MIEPLLTSIIILLTIPTAYLLYRITQDEKEIYKKYFPPILWILAIATAILANIDKIYALTILSIFLVILFWNNFDKLKKIK